MRFRGGAAEASATPLLAGRYRRSSWPDSVEFIARTFLVGDCISVAYGDLNADSRIDIFDIFCVLDGFIGVFGACMSDAVDLSPCEGDGLINIFDIFAVLDAFQGNPACSDGCASAAGDRRGGR